MNRHGKSSTLLMVLLILLTGAMLIGGTFAETFINLTGQAPTENYGTAPNVMDYAVTLSYYDADAVVPGYTDVFAPSAEVTDGLFWCPGRTEIIYLKVDNAEKFPAQAVVSVVASDVNGKQKFDKTLSYVVFDGVKQGDKLMQNGKEITSWAQVQGEQTLSTGSSEIPLVTTDLLATQGNAHYLALAIHMDESAGSKYMNAQMELDFKLRVNANYAPGADPAAPRTGSTTPSENAANPNGNQ